MSGADQKVEEIKRKYSRGKVRPFSYSISAATKCVSEEQEQGRGFKLGLAISSHRFLLF